MWRSSDDTRMAAADPRPDESRAAVQRRVLSGEIRARGDAEQLQFAGHGIVYDRWTEIYDPWFGSYQERIAPGAARDRLMDDVRLLLNHDANLLLARTTNQTMRLSEDGAGVLVEADFAPTTYARDVATLLRRGDISQMSFSFVPGVEEWDPRPDGTWTRTIRSFETLYDMSIVTFPAYPETDAGMRAARHRASVTEQQREAAEQQANRSALELQIAHHRLRAARFGLGR